MRIDELDVPTHERVVACRDPESGLRAFIALHDTTRGAAVGGCRMWPYADEEAALVDALRLSEGMSLKSAVASLPLGGGKSVILADPVRDKSEALLRAFGRCVEQLGGRYVAAEDVGMRVCDIEVVGLETSHVAGRQQGGAASGDPGPFTARGVAAGLRVAATEVLERKDLRGLRVAVQGVGSVGMHLCEHLHREGVHLLVADPSEARTQQARERFDAEVVPIDDVLGIPCDVLAPCALGGVLDDGGIERVKARVIAGAANNQLATPRHADALARRGILYVPDFVLNAGGIVNVAAEIEGDYDADEVRARVDAIADRVAALLRDARATGSTPNRLALAWARQNLRTASTRPAGRESSPGPLPRGMFKAPGRASAATGSQRDR